MSSLSPISFHQGINVTIAYFMPSCSIIVLFPEFHGKILSKLHWSISLRIFIPNKVFDYVIPSPFVDDREEEIP